MRKLSFLIAILVLLPAIPLFGAEDAGAAYYKPAGDISGTIVWSEAELGNDTVVVDSSFSILAGSSLTISNMSIRLHPGVTIDVHGTLNAHNTEFADNGTGRWEGIIFYAGSQGNINGCWINGTNRALRMMSSDVEILDTIIDEAIVGIPTGYMMQIEGATPTIRDVIVKTGGGRGLEVVNVPSSFTIEGLRVMDGDRGLNVDSCNQLVLLNSSFSSGNQTISLIDSHVMMKNSTRTGGWYGEGITISKAADILEVSWDVLVRVTDPDSSPIGGAEVTFIGNNNEESPPTFRYTDADGKIHFHMREVRKNGTGFINFSPYDFTATKSFYNTGLNETVPVEGYTVVNIVMEPVDIDPLPENPSYVISGPGILHRYGEEARLSVWIRNNGEDYASGPNAVPVYYADNRTISHNPAQRVNETKTMGLVEVPAGEAVQLMAIVSNLAPGWHNFSFVVDPYEVIQDKNRSNNALWNVFGFRVNVPPGLNVTNVTGGVLDGGPFTGPFSVSGYAWDNRTDLGVNITSPGFKIWYSVNGGGEQEAAKNLTSINWGPVNDTIGWNLAVDTTFFPDGVHNLTLRVDDGDHDYLKTVQFSTKNDQLPVLSNVTITPAEGNVTSTFLITANYTDETWPGGAFGNMEGNITVNFTSGPGGYSAVFNMTLADPNPPFTYNTTGQAFQCQLQLPETGVYTFHVAANDGTRGWVETNNHTITVIDIPLDIELELVAASKNITGPGEVHEYGEEARFTVWIKNNGMDDATGINAPQIYYVDNRTISHNSSQRVEDMELLGAVAVPAGQTVQRVFVLSPLAPGWHNFSFLLDPYNITNDKDRGNNELLNAFGFRVNVRPSLNITNETGGMISGGPFTGLLNISGYAWDNRTDLGVNITSPSFYVAYSIDGCQEYLATKNATNISWGPVNDTIQWSFQIDTSVLLDGLHTLMVRVNDTDHSYSRTVSFMTENDQPPVLNNVSLSPIEGNVTTTFVITVNYTDETWPGGAFINDPANIPGNITVNFTSGPDGFSAVFNMTVADPSNVTYNSTGQTFEYHFMPPKKGNYTFHIAAYDGANPWVETTSYNINVSNAPPAISNYGANQTTTILNHPIRFFARYQDADGEGPPTPLNTSAFVTIGGAAFAMTREAGSPNYTRGVNYTYVHAFTTAGLHEFNFTFSDGTDVVTTENMYIYVNHPPTLSNPSFWSPANPPTSTDMLYFNVTYNDTDGDQPVYKMLRVYHASNGTEAMRKSMITALGQPTPINYSNHVKYVIYSGFKLSKGVYNYTFTFNDSHYNITLGPFQFTIHNVPPTMEITGIVPLANARYEVAYNASDPDDAANITFYYGMNNTGQHGTPIPGGVAVENNGAGSIILDMGSLILPNRTFYIYTVIDDGEANSADVWDQPLFYNKNPVINSISPSTSVSPIHQSYVIEWTANDPEGDDITINLYYDNDQTPGGTILIAENLPASGSHAWNTIGVPNGTYYIVARARDGHGVVYETTRYSSGTVEVLHPSVSLTLQTNPASAQVYTSGAIIVSGTAVFNHPGYRTNVELEIVGTDIQRTTTPNQATNSYSFNITAPDAVGTYTIMVWVEVQNITFQRTAVMTVVRPPTPDLAITDPLVLSLSNPLAGERIDVDAIIRNIGDASGSATAYLYVDNITIGQHVDSKNIIIGAGQQQVASFQWTAAGQGSRMLWVAIDPANLLNELDKDNNNMSASVTVRTLPNFSISPADIIASNNNPVEGSNVSFTITVRNTGSSDGTCLIRVA
ncbi:MAG: CARDB domain-containing protein, partial [Candidatus Thermoplasmatota archaeon]|nr:CARDB domain-containing protein [Candidatus Thermoplasmatota archaeon]